MHLAREFHFDAAHSLPSYESAHPNSRIHGHSFRVRVTLEGQPAKATGQIFDLAILGQMLEAVRLQLDHHMLNEIDGLQNPTLENICLWLWDNLQTDLANLHAIEVFRDSLGQSCLYKGSHHGK